MLGSAQNNLVILRNLKKSGSVVPENMSGGSHLLQTSIKSPDIEPGAFYVEVEKSGG